MTISIPVRHKSAHPERKQTDESLRAERDKTDAGGAVDLTGSDDETADAVISRARARADQLLAAARAKADQVGGGQGSSSRGTVARSRVVEDRAVRDERRSADQTVRHERSERAVQVASERKETDDDLLAERARSDHALGMRDEFLGVVSHDLRNMLTGMVNFAIIIAKDSKREYNAERVAQHVQRIERASARMDRLIGDLIDVASIEAGLLAVAPELSAPELVVAEAVETYQARAAAAEITLVSDVAPSARASFDPARILQVLINLLSNAIKFTKPHGKVVVRLEDIADTIRFSVQDTGSGIAPDKLDAVFERFLQVDPNDRRGVGLGLYISKCIVEGHGGRIWVESTVGEGSTFYFTIPAIVAP